ncbi:MAG: GAF domain-containing protein [Bdellovibrionales bacterium]|nr:GAF domain-containing protein [Bdellovibrionales bacterium]
MAKSNEDLPLIILAEARTRSATHLEPIVQAFAQDGKDCQVVVGDLQKLMLAIQDPRCVCVFADSDFSPSILAFAKKCRQKFLPEWFFVTRITDKSYSYRVADAGAQGLLIEPVTAFQYVQRARQAFNAYVVNYTQRQLHPRTEVTAGDSRAGLRAGVELVTGNPNYEARRPEWKPISQSLRSRHFVGFDDLKHNCRLHLHDLVKDEPQAAARLMSVRVADPLATMPPKKVRALVSSRFLEDGAISDAADYPELLSAVGLQRAVVVADVRKSPRYAPISRSLVDRGVLSRAAIPLNFAGSVVGVMNLDFSEPLGPRTRRLVEDLVPFSADFVPQFSKMDYFGRIYSGAWL